MENVFCLLVSRFLGLFVGWFLGLFCFCVFWGVQRPGHFLECSQQRTAAGTQEVPSAFLQLPGGAFPQGSGCGAQQPGHSFAGALLLSTQVQYLVQYPVQAPSAVSVQVPWCSTQCSTRLQLRQARVLLGALCPQRRQLLLRRGTYAISYVQIFDVP